MSHRKQIRVCIRQVWQPNAPATLCDSSNQPPGRVAGRVVVFISRVWYSDPTYRGTRGRRADGSRADGKGRACLSSSSSSSPPSANTARQRSRAYFAVPTDGLNAMPSSFPLLKWNKPKLHYGYQGGEKWGNGCEMGLPSLNFYKKALSALPPSMHACMFGGRARTESITPVFKGRILLHGGTSWGAIQ